MTQEDDSAYLKTRGMVDQLLPPIPAKRYFTIGEVSELMCRQAACTALLGTRV